MRRGIALAGILAVACQALAQDAPDSFARELPDYETTASLWWGDDRLQPAGGYLFRFRLDLNGDGMEEALLSTSLFNSGVWSVYEADKPWPSSQFTLGLQPGLIFMRRIAETTELTTFYRLDLRTGKLHTDVIVGSAKPTNRERDLTTDELDEIDDPDFDWGAFARTNKLGEVVECEVEKIPLGTYIRQPETPWVPFNTDYAPDRQHLDPADRSMLMMAEGFTIEELRRTLSVRTNAPPALANGKAASLVALRSAHPEPVNEAEPATSRWRWIIVTAMAGVSLLLVLARLALRHRSFSTRD